MVNVLEPFSFALKISSSFYSSERTNRSEHSETSTHGNKTIASRHYNKYTIYIQ